MMNSSLSPLIAPSAPQPVSSASACQDSKATPSSGNEGNSFQATLSREVAGRSPNDDNAQADAVKVTSTAPASNPAGASVKADSKAASKADSEASNSDSQDTSAGTASDASIAASQDMLALVNSLQLNPAHTAPQNLAGAGSAVSAEESASIDTGATLGRGKKILTDTLTDMRSSRPSAQGQRGVADAAVAGAEPAPEQAANAGQATRASPSNWLDGALSKKTTEGLDGTALKDALSEAGTAITAQAKPLAGITTALIASEPTVNNAAQLQAAALQTAMQTTPVTGLNTSPYARLTPRVGSSNWDQALGQQVLWMAGNNQQTASLTLSPPDLGPLQVVLQVNNDQAHATFVAAQPEVRQALEAALPRLREMMSDAGIQLGQASVSANGGQAQFFNQDNGRQGRSGSGNGGANDAAASPLASLSATTVQRAGRGLVDTFA